MADRYDVIVVGSGPAGGSAAFYLGQAGKKVVILEKETLPRYKTCGGAVSLNFLRQFPFSFEPVIQSKVEAISYAVGEKMATFPLKDAALAMVMRDEFDSFLAQHAQADLHQGTTVIAVVEKPDKVEVETADGRKYAADHLVASDGANSTVARLLNLRRHKVMAGAIEIEAEVPPEVMKRYANRPVLIFGDLNSGYGWIFPKSSHLSVGVGALNPAPHELQAALERVIQRFGISIEGQPLHGHPVPFYLRPEKISTSRTLLTGDAAGLVDPLTGEGIRFAIKSGRLAAESILANRLERYPTLVRREIGRDHLVGYGIAAIFFPLTGPLFELVLRNPVLTRKVGQMVDDRIGYWPFLLAITATLPYYLLSRKTTLSNPALLKDFDQETK